MKKVMLLSLLGLIGLVAFAAPAPAQGPRGFIEGSLGYPSEFIPEDMVICAEDVATKKQYCTNKHLKGKKYQHGVGYRLEVPPGYYVVYAYLPAPERYGASYPKTYRAYYSEYVRCGLQEHCKSHKPVEFRVDADKTVSRVDPQDWYNF
jgi:hypothetical protein